MRRILFALAVSFLALAANAMPLADYIAALERIESLVSSHQFDAARVDARALIGQQIESPNGLFQADGALLGSIINAKNIDVRTTARLAATIAELRRTTGDAAVRPADDALLRKLENEQLRKQPKAGGELPTDEMTGENVNRFMEAFGKAWEWIAEKLIKFFEWLDSFFPKEKKKLVTTKDVHGMATGIAILVAIVVVILAWTAIRRSRRAAPVLVESAAPISSSRDDDPLSRASNEWEKYAAQLAAAGRYREAIRAWYHAVLVTLYGASILHFRKGRTNWEYVAALSPALPWRRDFIDLTRKFEHEWYGLTDSGEEALDDAQRMAKSILNASLSRGAA